jgi:hypothetical protein
MRSVCMTIFCCALASTALTLYLLAVQSTQPTKTPTQIPMPQPTAGHCWLWYPLGQPGSTTKVGLRNTCDECRIFTLNYVYFSGPSKQQNIRLEAHGAIQIEAKGTSSITVIDEQKCR